MVCDRNHASNKDATRVRVLVVEDDGPMADSLRRLLEMQGYDVRTVGCYKEALKTAMHWFPDVLVCDICLPDKSGLDVIRRLRSAHPNLKGIAVSGCTVPDDMTRMHEAGFSAYLAKPFSSDQLHEKIRKLVINEPFDLERLEPH